MRSVLLTAAGAADTPGYANGSRTNARFNSPGGMVVDAAGNLFVFDHENCVIRRISSAGQVTTFAGSTGQSGDTNGTEAVARFYKDQGSSMAIDASGNLYLVSDVICKITPGAVVTTYVQYGGATGLCYDTAGNLYFSHPEFHTIHKVSPSRVVTTIAGGILDPGYADGPALSARFDYPMDLAVLPNGELYITDGFNHTLRKLSSSGEGSTVLGRPAQSGSVDGTGEDVHFGSPYGMAVVSDGSLFVADRGNFTIRKITPSGASSTIAGSPGQSGDANGTGSSARFGGIFERSGPTDVAVDPNGNLFVTDSGNHTIRKISRMRAVTTFAGSSGTQGYVNGTGVAARFVHPSAIATDPAGNCYVVDQYGSIVRKITPAGIVTAFAGAPSTHGYVDATGNAARFGEIEGIACDSSGNVYVADRESHTIRKITPGGVVTTIAGGARVRGSADGVGTAARFSFLGNVTVDPQGNIYVVGGSPGGGNNTIRKITTGNRVTTIGGRVGITGYTDGIGTNAFFSSPDAIAVAPSVALYVSEWGSNRIRIGRLNLLAAPAAGASELAMMTAETDSDGDGMTDYQEAIAGTDPNDGESVLRIASVEVGTPTGGNRVVKVAFPVVQGRIYSVSYSDSLRAASWQKVADLLTPKEGAATIEAEVSIPAGPGRSFFRVEARILGVD